MPPRTPRISSAALDDSATNRDASIIANTGRSRRPRMMPRMIFASTTMIDDGARGDRAMSGVLIRCRELQELHQLPAVLPGFALLRPLREGRTPCANSPG